MSKINLGGISLKKAKKADVKPMTPGELTDDCAKELSDQAKLIRAQEKKLADRMDFDCERLYYFSIVFKGNEERNAFCKAHNIKLIDDDFVFIEDIENKFKE